MNLFLGIFVPQRFKPALWEKDAPLDSYLHCPELCDPMGPFSSLNQPSRWWDIALSKSLPFSLSEDRKTCLSIIKYTPRNDPFDLYTEQYRPHHLSIVNDLFPFKEVSHSVRDYMPNCETEYSPFIVREREVKRREENSSNNVRSSFAALLSWGKGTLQGGGSQNVPKIAKKNPSVAGTSSTASNISQTSDTDEEEEDLSTSDEFDYLPEIAEEAHLDPEVTICQNLSFSKLFKGTSENFGFELSDPDSKDVELYERFLKFDHIDKAHRLFKNEGQFGNLKGIKEAKTDSIFRPFDYEWHDYTKELLPEPSKEDRDIYENFVDVGKHAKTLPTKEDVEIYMNFLKMAKVPSKDDMNTYNQILGMIGEKDCVL